MVENTNYTPLDTEKLSAKKKPFQMPNKVLVGMILFFTVGVGVVGYLLTQEQFKTQVPAQVQPTVTILPSLSPTLPDVTPIETPTATESADTQTQQSTDTAQLADANSVPTETETPTPEPTAAEELSPTPTERAIGGYNDPSPTPTEIILAGATSTPTQETTEVPHPSEIPTAGVTAYAWIFAVLGSAIILFGFVL